MSLQARGSGLFERHCLAFHEQGLERLFRKLLAKPRPDGFAHELAHPVRNRAAISIDSLDRSHESRGAIELAYRFEHPGKADECVLAGHRLASRDLLQVDVLNASRKERLFTIFNNHLKSHFVRFTAGDPAAEQARANELRRRQCQAAAAIIVAETRPNSRYLVLGDMNDPPDSEFMAPLAESTQLKLTLGLSNPTETRPAPGSPPPPTVAWTERFKPSGKPAVYTLMDQVWLSPALAAKQTGAFIDRRSKVSGDGSDHDPAWITLNL
jgi:hypothetical protein